MKNRTIIAFIFVAALLVLPIIFPRESQVGLLNACGVMIVFALSYNVLLGQAGLLSFGHAIYFGLPAFAAVHLINVAETAKLPIPLPLVPLASGLVGLLLAMLLGSISTKRGGVTFAMITLGLGELIYASAPILPSLFGGEDGIRADRTALAPVLGFRFGSSLQMYYLIYFWVSVVVVALHFFRRSPMGHLLEAVRENPQRTEFIGFSTPRLRYVAVVISGLVAGVSGGLAAANYEIVSYASLSATQSGNALLMVCLGGSGVFWGPILGAVVVTILQTFLSDYTQSWMLYFGLLFMFIVLYMPAGIAWWLTSHWRVLKSGEGRRLLGPYIRLSFPVFAFGISVIFLIEMIRRHLTRSAGQGVFAWFGLDPNTDATPAWVAVIAICAGSLFLIKKLWVDARAAWSQAARSSPRAVR
jgi:branched-chain amino acid transport system permease protein